MKKIALSLLLTAMSGLGCLSASAAPISLTVTAMQYSPASTVRIQSTQGPLDTFVYSGAFATTTSDRVGSFASWCIDIFQSTNIGTQVNDYNRLSGIAALGQQKTSMLEQLAATSLGLVNSALTSSAFQLAAWEIVNETNGAFSLSTGSFKASGASDGALALATNWLGSFQTTNSPVRYELSVLRSATRQDLAVFTQVPEPSTIAILAAGMFGFGAARRRSRRAA